MTLKESLPESMQAILQKRSGYKRVLNLEVPAHTTKIPSGRWELTGDVRKYVLDKFLAVQNCVLTRLLEYCGNEFAVDLKASATKKINWAFPTVLDLQNLFTPMFHRPGCPKQLVNINKFIKYFNIENDDPVQPGSEYDEICKSYLKVIQTIISSTNTKEFKLKDVDTTKIFLRISDAPKDFLNLSVSPFFNSCLNIYTGSQFQYALYPVFDKLTKIMFIEFDVPYKDPAGNVHESSIISRSYLNIKSERAKTVYVVGTNSHEGKFADKNIAFVLASVVPGNLKFLVNQTMPVDLATLVIDTNLDIPYYGNCDHNNRSCSKPYKNLLTGVDHKKITITKLNRLYLFIAGIHATSFFKEISKYPKLDKLIREYSGRTHHLRIFKDNYEKCKKLF